MVPTGDFGQGGVEQSSQQPSPSPMNDHITQPTEGAEKYTDINEILDRILQSDMSIDNSRKISINNHRMKPALFSVFCEIKERTCLNYNNLDLEDPPDPQLMRLDNMLIV